MFRISFLSEEACETKCHTKKLNIVELSSVHGLSLFLYFAIISTFHSLFLDFHVMVARRVNTLTGVRDITGYCYSSCFI